MSRTLEYPKTARNTVVRRGHRGKYDLETIHTLINTSLVLNVSFAPDTDEDFPVILPMIGVMGSVSSSHLSSRFSQSPVNRDRQFVSPISFWASSIADHVAHGPSCALV
jgi:hypothetical protein